MMIVKILIMLYGDSFLEALVIPFQTFKEKIRITKEYSKYKIEVFEDYILVRRKDIKIKVFNKDGNLVYQGVAVNGKQHEEITSRYPRSKGYKHITERSKHNATNG